MPLLSVPIILLAGLTVGIGAAIYSNREELKDIYSHRDEIVALINQKRLEWRLRRGRRPHQAASSSSGSTTAQAGSTSKLAHSSHSDNYSVYELEDNDDGHNSDDTESFNDFPQSTSFYTNGQSSSAVDTIGNTSSETRDLRHRAGVELNHRRRRSTLNDEDNDPRHTVEMYGFHYAPSSLSSSSDTDTDYYPRNRPRNMRRDSQQSDSLMSEPALSYSSSRNSTTSGGWVRPQSPSSMDDSFSEISTPSASDANAADEDDYQHLIYSDDESGFRGLRAAQL